MMSKKKVTLAIKSVFFAVLVFKDYDFILIVFTVGFSYDSGLVQST